MQRHMYRVYSNNSGGEGECEIAILVAFGMLVQNRAPGGKAPSGHQGDGKRAIEPPEYRLF
eukprot:267359-Amorphochlora_amoeboformis.AAC.1